MLPKSNKKHNKEHKEKEDWMQNKWRPAMGWMYMSVCLFDFIVAPILYTIVQFWETQAANDAFREWVPLTLQGGGLFHIAIGAVLGVSAYGRTQEKMAGAAGNGANNMGMGMNSGMGMGMNNGMNSGMNSGMGMNNNMGMNNGMGMNNNINSFSSPSPMSSPMSGPGTSMGGPKPLGPGPGNFPAL